MISVEQHKFRNSKTLKSYKEANGLTQSRRRPPPPESPDQGRGAHGDKRAQSRGKRAPSRGETASLVVKGLIRLCKGRVIPKRDR